MTPVPGPQAAFYTLNPCRLADTRGPSGATGAPALSANTSRTFPIAGLCGVPSTAKAVAVNVTVVMPSEGGHLTLYPAGDALPLASTINFRSSTVRANNAILQLGTSGAISVFMGAPSGTTDVVIDVNGYFE